jgi:hypothetical protein
VAGSGMIFYLLRTGMEKKLSGFADRNGESAASMLNRLIQSKAFPDSGQTQKKNFFSLVFKQLNCTALQVAVVTARKIMGRRSEYSTNMIAK